MQNLFGTDGIRGTIGAEPFTQDSLIKLGNAIGTWACKKYGKNSTIILAHDTRISCSFVKASLKSGMLLHSIGIHDAHILPTPAICFLTKQNADIDCGIIISASHNPYQDNGIKIIDTHNGKLTEEDEQYISQLFYKNNNITYEQLGIDLPIPDAHAQYIHTLTQLCTQDLAGLTIVLDCAHGATSTIAPIFFEQLGAQVITLNNAPDGYNINKDCGALFPTYVQHAVIKHNAAIGFAFDGDGDRLIVINKDGVIKDGDDILAFLLNHPHYADQKGIVGTVMSNQGLETYIQQQNKQFFRSSVGDKHVATLLKKESLLLGGEPSGHIIMTDYLEMGDGIATALRILETMIHTNNWHMNTFTKYPQTLINIPVATKKDLSSPPLNHIINTYQAKLHNGRLLIRYSGTENLLRVMVEDRNSVQAQTVCKQLADALAHEINKI